MTLSPDLRRRLPDLCVTLGLALACAVCASAPAPALAGGVAAIAVAALVAAPPERWPALVLATAAGGASGAMVAGTPAAAAWLAAAARAIEVLAAADMLRWFARGRFRLVSARDAAGFGVVTLAAPALGALVAKALLELNGATMSAGAWWAADATGLVAAGAVCAWRAARESARALADERDAAAAGRDAALAELTRVLDVLHDTRAVLPVCSACGDFREDVTYWLTLDRFRFDHADAVLGAGECPHCAAAHADAPDWNALFRVDRAA